MINKIKHSIMNKTNFFNWIKSNVQSSKVTKGYISGYFYINIYGITESEYEYEFDKYKNKKILSIKNQSLPANYTGTIRNDNSIQILYMIQA